MTLAQRSMFISALIHVSLFAFFVFQFPARQVAEQPKLFFLGSILYKQDVLIDADQKNTQQSKMISEKLIHTATQTTAMRHTSRTIAKPSEQRLSIDRKKTIKSLFDDHLSKTPTEINTSSDNAINQNPAAYEPLHLFSPW